MKISKQKTSLIQSMRSFTLRILIIGLAGAMAVGIFDRIVLMNTTVISMTEDYHSRKTAIIRTEVENVYRLIRFGIEHNLSRKEVLDAVRKIRFGTHGDGYVFINSYNGIAILHDTQRELEGKNLWEITDPKGVRIIQEQRKAIEKPEGGFIYYFWNKPSISEISPKATFVMGIPEWEWMIGAGVYLDDIEEEVSFQQKKLYRELLVRALLFLIFLLLIFQYIFRSFRKFTSFVSKEISAFTELIEESTITNNDINLDKIYYKEFLSAARDTNIIISDRIRIQNEISSKNIELKKSLDEKEVLLKEVHHRVKNNLAIISSLLSLQSMDIDDNSIQDLLKSSQNRVRSMALVHELLYKSEILKYINLRQYINELIDSLMDNTGNTENQVVLKIDIADIELEFDLLIPLGMLINEIISNSLKYAFDNCAFPELTVSLRETGDTTLHMNIRDNGSGFDIDKAPDNSGSIGLMLIKGLTTQINGNLKLNAKNGTEYEINFLR